MCKRFFRKFGAVRMRVVIINDLMNFTVLAHPSQFESELLSDIVVFTFSFSPKSIGRFQLCLAQGKLEWVGFKFVQIKDQAFLQREIIVKHL